MLNMKMRKNHVNELLKGHDALMATRNEQQLHPHVQNVRLDQAMMTILVD